MTRDELKELIEAKFKQHPHHPMLTVLLGNYCESPKEQQRHQELIDGMLAAWSQKFAIDGPDYVDKNHAQQSFRAWFVAKDLTIRRDDNEPLSDSRRQKLLPIIKQITQRMQSQMPAGGVASSDRLNAYQVKTFRRESQQMLEWVELQQ